tara:strand:+ start:3146 stop:3706 length:561 start_codon:yes stop_codon:yes gene_type:complete
MIDLIRAQLITYNLVCTMLADVNKRHTFQWDINSDISLSPHYLSPDDCENDKANEIVLRNIRSGKYIRVYDNPEMKRNDDWIEIIASGSIDKATINPLEEIDANLRRKVRQNGNLIVKYHTGDNSDFLSGSDFDGDLSGKVNGIEFDFESFSISIYLHLLKNFKLLWASTPGVLRRNIQCCCSSFD